MLTNKQVAQALRRAAEKVDSHSYFYSCVAAFQAGKNKSEGRQIEQAYVRVMSENGHFIFVSSMKAFCKDGFNINKTATRQRRVMCLLMAAAIIENGDMP